MHKIFHAIPISVTDFFQQGFLLAITVPLAILPKGA